MAKINCLDDIINDEFLGLEDLSKEDDSVDYWIDSQNYALKYI
jgi:hypothetical protein